MSGIGWLRKQSKETRYFFFFLWTLRAGEAHHRIMSSDIKKKLKTQWTVSGWSERYSRVLGFKSWSQHVEIFSVHLSFTIKITTFLWINLRMSWRRVFDPSGSQSTMSSRWKLYVRQLIAISNCDSISIVCKSILKCNRVIWKEE